jgi:hypothetical protein
VTWLRGYTRARPDFSQTCDYWASLDDSWTELIQGPGLEPGGEWIVKNTYPACWTDDLWTAIRLWERWKTFGLPFDPSWGKNPAVIVDAIELVENVIGAEHGRSR